MKRKSAAAVGIVIGNTLFQLIRYGVSEADWTKVIFVSIFAVVFMMAIPTKWTESSKLSAN